MATVRRILHVNKFLHRRGGAESYMLDLAAMQHDDRDAETAFFGMSHAQNDAMPYAEHFVPEATLRPMPSSRKAQATVAVNMLWHRRAASGIAAVVEKFRPDVAHLHNIYHQLSPSILGPLKAAGVPIVMTLHDYKLACPAYQFMRDGSPCTECLGGTFLPALRNRCGGSTAGSGLLALESTVHRQGRAYAPVDVFHCPSSFLHAKMTESGVYPDRLHHLPLFRTPPAVAAGPAGTGTYGLYAGRLAIEKGVESVISALGRCPNGELVIAGDGPERSNLERQAETVAPGRVRFVGHVSHARVDELLTGARFAMVPSNWFENQPLSILDAMGSARPVLASDLGGMAELVEHETDGLLVAPGDLDGWSRAMTTLFADPDRATRMGEAGQQKVRRVNDPARHLDGIEELYAVATARREVVHA